jgi:hypothetical protein
MGVQRVFLSEDNDKAGSCLKERLVCVRAKRRQCFQPIKWRSRRIEFLLLSFGSFPNLLFDSSACYHSEVPWLSIGTRGCAACCSDTVLNNFNRNSFGGEVADGAPGSHRIVKVCSPLLHVSGIALGNIKLNGFHEDLINEIAGFW